MREVVADHLQARVPTCPDWTVDDLTWHLGMVYLHKAAGIREGGDPAQWPPPHDDDDSAIELIDGAHRQLLDAFAAHGPDEPGGTWYGSGRTVRFWLRRMAQETVIHRVDAELSAGALVAPVPDGLAIDGIDELLKVFIAYSFSRRPAKYAAALENSPPRSYVIRTDATNESPAVTWRVQTAPDSLTVAGGPDEQVASPAPSDVTISGTPADLLRWIWNRETAEPTPVSIKGDPEALTELRNCVVTATQ
jgi:uncharacterized protein (TIGR03083 family)